jgi:hypothetical protein
MHSLIYIYIFYSLYISILFILIYLIPCSSFSLDIEINKSLFFFIILPFSELSNSKSGDTSIFQQNILI